MDVGPTSEREARDASGDHLKCVRSLRGRKTHEEARDQEQERHIPNAAPPELSSRSKLPTATPIYSIQLAQFCYVCRHLREPPDATSKSRIESAELSQRRSKPPQSTLLATKAGGPPRISNERYLKRHISDGWARTRLVRALTRVIATLQSKSRCPAQSVFLDRTFAHFALRPQGLGCGGYPGFPACQYACQYPSTSQVPRGCANQIRTRPTGRKGYFHVKTWIKEKTAEVGSVGNYGA